MNLSKICLFTIILIFSSVSTGFTSSHTTALYFDQDPEVMTVGMFKIHNHLSAVIKHFDFDFKCGIRSFRLVRVTKRNDPIIIENHGAVFSSATLKVINMAKVGDYYFFENIRAKCAGDDLTRRLPAITVKIK